MKTRFDSIESVTQRVGQMLGTSAWMTMEQSRVDQFAEATDDRQWIHVNPERALQGPFGACIAHGYLTLSLVSRFLPEILELHLKMGVNYGVDKVRFPAPVRVGDRIRAQAELLAAELTRDGGVQATIRVTVDIENGSKPACVADTIARYYF